MNREAWTEKRSAKSAEEYVAQLRAWLPVYPDNVTVELVSIDGQTKTGRQRFTIRLEKDAK